jgi:CubicO group peptidase (beta-lactamase class C family)
MPPDSGRRARRHDRTTRRRRLLIGLLVLLLVVVTAVVAVYWWQRPLLLTGTGYAAHNDCAVRHVAGRSDPDSDLPPNPLVPHLSTSEPDDTRVDASLRGLLAGQTAWHTDGFGCTLADDRPDLPTPTEVTEGHRWTDAPVAEPAAAGQEVERAIGLAFGDDLAEQERDELGTRAVVVLHEGRLLAERYADGFDEDTPQLGWSLAKSVTNLMVGRLVGRGDLSLDDDRLREEWTDERADITVDDLVRMTSGLGWDETYELGTPITRMLYLEPDMAAYVASQPAQHEPGTYQEYSSGSTNLLCDVIAEKAGARGADRADLPRRLVFEPLGLTSAVMEPDASGNPVCSSYMWATPRDWAVVGQLALQQGRWGGEQLLPSGWMRQSTAHREVEQSEEEGHAGGWWVNREHDGTIVDGVLPEDAYEAKGHDGQRIVVVPSADLVVVRLGFTPELDDARTSTLVDDLVTALRPGS